MSNSLGPDYNTFKMSLSHRCILVLSFVTHNHEFTDTVSRCYILYAATPSYALTYYSYFIMSAQLSHRWQNWTVENW